MSKIHNNIPEHLLKQLPQLGYQPVKPEDQRVFNPYYDQMNGHWSSPVSFLCTIAWNEATPTFYKPVGDLLCCMLYEATLGEWVALPFIGYSSALVSTFSA